MGAAMSAVAGAALGLIPTLLELFRRAPIQENPTMSTIEEQLRIIERGREEAEERAQQAVYDAEAARAAREEAERQVHRYAEEQAAAASAAIAARERAEQNARDMEAEAHRARVEQERAEREREEARRHAEEHAATSAAALAAKLWAEQLAQEKEVAAARARIERELAEKEREEAAFSANMAREDLEASIRAQQTAEARAANAFRQAETARSAQEEAEKRWRKGIRPVEWPTRESFEAAKSRYGYTQGKFHLAIAGVSGTGKSSLINSFRGLRDGQRGAAATDVVESTTVVQPYPDPDPENPFIWFDVPGAGTLNVPDWTYFNDEGLYIFDSIIVLFDNRFTAIDIAILKNCRRFKIPCYIVRSKSDLQIRELAKKKILLYNSDDEDEPDDSDIPQHILEEAKGEYIAKTRESVNANLSKSDLPSQNVYLVSRDTLRAIVTTKKGKSLKKGLLLLDEDELLKDLLMDGLSRRSPKTYENVTSLLKKSAKSLLGFDLGFV